MVASALKVRGGVEVLLDLRHLPGVMAIMTAGVAACSARRWANLKTLAADPSVQDRWHQGTTSILEATDPYKPFDGQGWTPNTLARAAQRNISFTQALEDFTQNRVGKYYTPVGEWLYQTLRPLFADQWPDDDSFATEFDRAEVMLGVLGQDAVSTRLAGEPEERRNWGRSYWFGRSTWRAAQDRGNPVVDVQRELAAQGELWGPLRSGLFGGNADRAQAALEKYAQTVDELSRRRF